jgi:hypothetical protein
LAMHFYVNDHPGSTRPTPLIQGIGAGKRA